MSLAKLAGGPIPVSKHKPSGIARRLDVLQAVFPNIVEAMTAPAARRPRPGRDDRLDACRGRAAMTASTLAAAAWTARRLASGDADCLGASESDDTGYPMNIWV